MDSSDMLHQLHILRCVCLQAAAGPEDTEFDSECTKVYESPRVRVWQEAASSCGVRGRET